MKVQLGGHLSWHDEYKRSKLDIHVDGSISLNALLRQLSIPRGEVALISINGKMFEGEDVLVKETDTILLFPPIGGG